ncbi:MAG TPA: N-acetylmuramoyl-L-alanine amidase [Spirochaetota bacterium]|nr:N-acetylmuramoyl-L-alanine amidase [Spirochaetota bacterium]HPI89111.1 N-acetylmuramoyl-L-alanine amidase [Spirochaetota bacterium]HPR48865.1 N-acetylmuramoyl-L-alanine amidase [Spirochaetota bacterium]
MHRNALIVIFIIFFSIFQLYPSSISMNEFPEYRVVIDPGHGGVSSVPKSVHGDRFDTVTGTYLDYYRDGASRYDIDEHRIMYSIAARVYRLLRDCSGSGEYGKFHDLLSRYTSSSAPRIQIVSVMSRPESASEEIDNKDTDVNGEYRLFDYPDEKGRMQQGRMSCINGLKPHLVVSLHCASSGPGDYKGMSAVIVPPHDFLHEGLRYLQNKRLDRDFFTGELAEYWFCETVKRTNFSWFLNDVSLYFTSYPLDRFYSQRFNRYKGYRHNMVQWNYRDPGEWEIPVMYMIRGSQFAGRLASFEPEGPFWDRERSRFESYRRDNGPEGYGGDNLYASNEIIRFITCALEKNGHGPRYTKPAKPYVSVWALPLLVNAVSAYVELGYLGRKDDRNMMLHRQKEIAEGIAVGIYSLFAGINVNEDCKEAPKGKRIDLTKYSVTSEKSYFEAVIE